MSFHLSGAQDWQQDAHRFHQDGCSQEYLTPAHDRQAFCRRGKSGANGQRWQCQTCGKITSLVPSRRESFTYRQKRSEIIHAFVRLLLNKTPISRACETLHISPQTYYRKLELVYERSLEFLNKHERPGLLRPGSQPLLVDTGVYTYLRNTVGRGRRQVPTEIVVSVEAGSGYVVRADLSADVELIYTVLAQIWLIKETGGGKNLRMAAKSLHSTTAVERFVRQIHSRLSFLERPFMDESQPEGRDCRYANYNPKYAQYAVTVLRTYYNYCLPLGRQSLTPAQKLGIVGRKYAMKDVVYVK